MATIPVTVTVTDKNGQMANSVGGTVTPGGTTTGPVKVGETKVLSATDNGNGNLLFAQPITIPQVGSIQSLSFYVRVLGGQLRLGLYANVGGKPGPLIAQTAAFTPATVGWITQVTTTTPVVSAGPAWLAALPQSNTLGFWKADTGGTSYFKTGVTFGNLPTTFPSSPSTTPSHWSFYGTFQETTTVPTIWVNSVAPGGVVPPSPNDPWINLDGRLNAPSGTPQFPTLLNTYHPAGPANARYRTGQSISQSLAANVWQPPWMVAGVDYYVGIDRGLYPTDANLKDPWPGFPTNTVGSLHADLQSYCTAAGGGGLNPTITATGSNRTMDGFDYSLHGGISLDFLANGTISNCNFASRSGNTNWNIFLGNSSGDHVTMTNCVINSRGDEGINFQNSFGAVASTHSFTIQYCWIRNGYGRSIVGAAQASDTPLTILCQYNLWENAGGFGFPLTGDHGDWMQIYTNPANTLGTYTYIKSLFNTAIQNTTEGQANTQGWSVMTAATTGSAYNHAELNNNTFVIINATLSVSPIIGADSTWLNDPSGTSSMRDNYYDDTSASADFEFWPDQNGGGPFNSTMTLSNISMLTGAIHNGNF